MASRKSKYLVAEISKTWIDGEGLPDSPVGCLSEMFENVINGHDLNGYDLVDWRLSTTFGVVPVPAQVFGDGAGSKSNLVETIVAMFKARDCPAS